MGLLEEYIHHTDPSSVNLLEEDSDELPPGFPGKRVDLCSHSFLLESHFVSFGDMWRGKSPSPHSLPVFRLLLAPVQEP